MIHFPLSPICSLMWSKYHTPIYNPHHTRTHARHGQAPGTCVQGAPSHPFIPQAKAEGIRPGKSREVPKEAPGLPSRQEGGTRSFSKRYMRSKRKNVRPLLMPTAAGSAHWPWFGESCNYLLAYWVSWGCLLCFFFKLPGEEK